MIYRRRVFNALALKYTPGDSLAALGAVFTGPASRTYLDGAGALQTVGANTPRDAHVIAGVRTLLLEGARTNSFLNSDAPATHTSPSLGTGTYTLWLVGTGSIAVAAGTATITGAGTATSAAPVTFTVTVAGTVTFTVTGTPTRAQCENGAFPSSYIATTAAAVTRAAETLYFPWSFVPQPATSFMKANDLGAGLTSSAMLFLVTGATFLSPYWGVQADGVGDFAALHHNGTVQRTSAPPVADARNDVIEFRTTLDSTGAIQAGMSKNGAAESNGAASAANAFGVAWGGSRLWINGAPSQGTGFLGIQSLKFALGVRDLATMRAAN